MDNIKVGSTVQLKSGGPRMTVESFSSRLSGDAMTLHTQEDKSRVNCQWFEGKKLQEGTFNVSVLKVVTEEEDSISWGVI